MLIIHSHYSSSLLYLDLSLLASPCPVTLLTSMSGCNVSPPSTWAGLLSLSGSPWHRLTIMDTKDGNHMDMISFSALFQLQFLLLHFVHLSDLSHQSAASSEILCYLWGMWCRGGSSWTMQQSPTTFILFCKMRFNRVSLHGYTTHQSLSPLQDGQHLRLTYNQHSL